MANFTCDICGGTIKMQGSQGGVCQNCGMEYDIEAIRAKVNTAPHQAPTYQQATPAYQQQVPMGYVQQPVMSQPTNQQGVIDRQALLIHLNDLRTMETILYESNEKKIELDNKNMEYKTKLEQAEEEYSITERSASKLEKERVNLDSSIIGCKKRAIGLFIAGSFILIICVIVGIVERDSTSIYAAQFLSVPLLALGIKEIYTYRRLKNGYLKSLRERREIIIESQESNLAEKEKQEKWYDRWSKESREIRTEIITEEDYTKEMLQKAYNANIIPLQFRTIEGVYYLYDYLSTSNQTLAEALLQANLEAIKQRLEQVIESQGKLIVEQQQTNAQLANIQQTNQQILETAKRTAANTAQAAQYAQIAATNTELLAKLNKKQLAYQRADFWLK